MNKRHLQLELSSKYRINTMMKIHIAIYLKNKKPNPLVQ